MRKLMPLLLATTLAACVSTDPYTGQQKTSNTAKGAGAGAVAGAVIGAATASSKDRKKGALTGAVAGGAIGGGIGFYMDKQEAQLRQKLQNSGVQVVREGDNIRLVMPGNITFATGQSAIRGDFYETLSSVALVLVEFKDTAIRVAGHTDSTGAADMNQRLSEDRANSVKQYLISQNIPAGRIQANGYGPRYPVASNATPEGRQANRRVELELIPLTQ
ncbi:MAG: OmpA family protein [Gammaproteobacteria bacterium]|uniref:OmpA family protein n=1 Tax=Pseudomaricurvus alcaniphilus TaxID=1166482 RepID=UPI00140A412B|nr:OmpA family protein [Pseudomaricurvus alcaniphilus]MBR9912807.1 OmpA family protein [Gammaproteobacteria bacterium]NHN37787.1 OmpA family protein [Pseudomaricurvus alcaniphilus]